jgi:hypothetical protein
MASGGVWLAGGLAANGLLILDRNRCSLGLPSLPCQPKRDGRLRQTAQYLATMLPSSFLLCLELGKALDVETA